jgi:cell division transport system permease protein
MNLTLRESMLTFKRAPLLSALSVTTIAFSLFVLGLFGLVVVNLQEALRGVEERVEVVAYLLPGAPIEATAQALKDIEAFPEVQSATYVSEDDALARARAELVELRDVMQELERNPLPASIEVKLKPGFRDAGHVSAVAERLRGFGFVDDVRFGRDWVERLDRLRGVAAAVGIVVGAAFAVVAIIIIGTTIRMAVLQRSREIAIMRLVGATNGFVRRPFLLQGAIKGLLGGGVAVALSFVAYLVINRYLLLRSAFFSQEQAAAIVAFGALIGLFGSAMSVGRHLKRV